MSVLLFPNKKRFPVPFRRKFRAQAFYYFAPIRILKQFAETLRENETNIVRSATG